MERHQGTKGIALVECISPRLRKYRVRWDVQPYEDPHRMEAQEERESNAVDFVEHEFNHKPTLEEVASVIKGSGVAASADELRAIAAELEGDKLEFVKSITDWKIELYDHSSKVNSFKVGEMEMWLDKATRVGLANSIAIEETAGRDNTRLWFGDMEYTIPIVQAKQVLAAVELYALDCYNVTASHRANVDKMETEEGVLLYDFTSGYPEQLQFYLSE